MILEGWNKVKWGDVAILEYGKSLKNYQGSRGPIPVYGTNGLIGYTDIPLCQIPSVIVGRKGAYRGIHFSKTPFYVIDTAFYLKPKGNDLDLKYAYYQLLTLDINGMDSGSAIPSTSRQDFYNLNIYLPDKGTQKRIASILSSLDDKIELNLQMNKTLEAIARAIFKEWFVDFRFPGFDGVLVDGLPKGWRKGNLGENFNITMGQSPPGESYNDTGEGTIFFQGRTDFGFRFPENRIYTTSPNRLARNLDTLVSVRAPVGDINMALEDCCIGRGLSSVRHNSGAYSYSYYAMKRLEPIFKGFDGEGTIFGSINKTNFENISTIAPDEKVIMGFERVVNTLDEKIINNSIEIKTLTQIRDSLLPRLMTGKIRVA